VQNQCAIRELMSDCMSGAYMRGPSQSSHGTYCVRVLYRVLENRPETESVKFRPGESGNPGGRPPLLRDFRTRCQHFMTKSGWATLEQLATDPTSPHRSAVLSGSVRAIATLPASRGAVRVSRG
jgi:hypothetical protein